MVPCFAFPVLAGNRLRGSTLNHGATGTNRNVPTSAWPHLPPYLRISAPSRGTGKPQMPKRVFQPGAQPRNSAFAQHMTVTHLQYSLAIREVACWWAATSKGNLWLIQRQHSICHTNKWVWPFWSVPFLVWLEGPPKGNHIFRNICIYI